ncbi:MAG: hypothetical protein ACSLFJ_00260 [Immundisolibacter sp.]|uniref:hypothetical protein n=1 Tax=Immundisolibacter sp. TaxID=1934948 RepID=UPI003EE24F4E
MTGQIDDSQLNEDDIPTLTEIVVPGRVQGETATDLPELPTEDGTEPTSGGGFDVTLDELDDLQLVELAEPVAMEPAPEDVDLPLPWAADEAPPASPDTAGQISPEVSVNAVPEAPARVALADVSAVPTRYTNAVPLIVAAHAKAETELGTPTVGVDENARLRAVVNDIGASLERRLQAEVAQLEQRLRVAMREELDACLRHVKDHGPSAS